MKMKRPALWILALPVVVGVAWLLAADDASPRADGSAAFPAAAATALPGSAATTSPHADFVPENAPPVTEVVTVYKSPTCRCCTSWVGHLREQGFTVKVEEARDMAAVKRRLNVPGRLTSCHTAVVAERLVEGHVPADALRRFLGSSDFAEMAGLAVPGMPVGSPGMEIPGRGADPYEILAFDAAGRTTVFERR